MERMEATQLAIVWWHWVVLGIVLASLEIFVPSFILLWLGIAAILVGVLLWFVPIALSTQLFLWTGLSTLLLLLWFLYFRRTPRFRVGQSEDEYAHIAGRIVEVLDARRYRAEFDLPVLGDRVWIVESQEPLRSGDRVEVVKVYGQILRVKPLNRKETP